MYGTSDISLLVFCFFVFPVCSSFSGAAGVPVPPVAAPELEKWGEYEMGNATFYVGAKRAICFGIIGLLFVGYKENLSARGAREIVGHFIHSNNRLAYIYIRESEINTLKLGDPVTARETCTNLEQMLIEVQ